MILYFSGTGNSRFAAQLIGKDISDEVVSLNEQIKGRISEPLASERPFVIVCPVYAWRIPKVVNAFFQKAQFQGSRKAYFVVTCGNGTGNAVEYARELCRDKGLEFMGLASVVMPENYVALYDAPGPEEAKASIQRAVPRLHEVARQISAESPLPKEPVSFSDRFRSDAVNPIFYRAIVSAKGFYATDACIGCGKCAGLCPLNNIILENRRPRWGKSCTHCMACIGGCPVGAIEYKNHTKGKQRYYNTENV